MMANRNRPFFSLSASKTVVPTGQRLALVAFENEISWGLRRIAQFLRSRGFEVSLYFLERYANLPRGVPEATRTAFLEDFAPREGDVVGIGFMTPYLEVARDLGRRIKSRGGLVVVGGIHPTIVPEDCGSFADYVVRGEGEEALALLLQDLQAGSSPIKGVFRKENDFWFNEHPEQFPYPCYGEILDTIIVQGQVQKTGEVPRAGGPSGSVSDFYLVRLPLRLHLLCEPPAAGIKRSKRKKISSPPEYGRGIGRTPGRKRSH